MCSLKYLVPLVLIAAQASAQVIVADFSGRTVSGDTASDIGYTLSGIESPGDLTVIENESNGVNDGTAALGGLFDTGATANFFAPDLNIDNEDGWYVDVPLTFSAGTTELSITTLDFTFNHFTNSGGSQGNSSARTDWRAELIGSSSGVFATDSVLDVGGTNASGPYTQSLDLTATLGDTQTWTLRIYSDYNGGPGNNAGLTSFSLNAVPEPSTALFLFVSGLSIVLAGRHPRMR